VNPTSRSAIDQGRLKRQRQHDTSPELALRRELFRRGLRFRVHLRLLPDLRRRVDVSFPRHRVAVDVRGCFWHVCPTHRTQPKSNQAWWAQKLQANVVRDADTERRLAAAGWLVVIVWEHELAAGAADRVIEALKASSTPPASSTCNSGASA
jgi:DNA mismatch endonuclease (patch repair protein)